MQTSLQGIANRASSQAKHRFGNLYGLLNEENLKWCFYQLRKDAAPGVPVCVSRTGRDGVDYYEYQKNLEANIHDLVERLKKKSYRAKFPG